MTHPVIESLVREHGEEVVREALSFVVDLVKARRHHKVVAALDGIDRREAELVDRARRKRQDEPTVPHRIADAGEAMAPAVPEADE